MVHAVVHDEPPGLREIRPDLPAGIEAAGIEAIVKRALQKDPARRYQSAAEMVQDLSAALVALESPPRRVGLRAAYAIPAAVLILLTAAASVRFYERSEKRHWAREQAIPGIGRLAGQTKPLAAFRLMQEAQSRPARGRRSVPFRQPTGNAPMPKERK